MSNKLFSKLNQEGFEENQDRLGGFSAIDSGIYIGTIKTAYAGQSQSGAQSVTLLIDLSNGKEYRETLYITDRTGKNYFLNKNDNTKKVALPGFVVVDDICLIATNNSLADQETEDKVVKVYDVDAKAEVPKTVPCLTALHGKSIALAIVKEHHNKQVLQGNEYVPTADTIYRNSINKVFHPTMRITVVEARNGQNEPKFWDAWSSTYTGTVIDKRSIKENSGPATPPKAGSTSDKAPTKSLFS